MPTKLREQVKNGGAILGQPRRFVVGVGLPELGSYIARLGIVAVFMAAYSIPVTFHSVVAVTASNSVSNSVSVTPGGAGVNQAFNVAVLGGTTSSANAAAYSLGQQLIITAWDVYSPWRWSPGCSAGQAASSSSRSPTPRPKSRSKSSNSSVKRGAPPVDTDSGSNWPWPWPCPHQ